MIFDKKLSISTFELEKDILNRKISYEDEEKEEIEEEEEILRYNSDELKIEKFEIVISDTNSKIK